MTLQLCLNLYAYANGDPINYSDSDGRFASYAYQVTKPAVIEAIQPFGLNLAKCCSNSLAAYLANHQSANSMNFQAGYLDLPNGAIGFINGINNTNQQFRESAWQMSQYAQGSKVYGTYNATNLRGVLPFSIVADVLECGMGHMGFHTPPVQILKNQWNHFIATHAPKAKFLQYSHSGGALQVYNALLASPKSVQERIISVALAPAVIIPKKLCFQSYNYVSRRDLVTHLDLLGKLKYRNELQILEPHPEASFWDHEFLSPTFKDPIELHITNYIKNYGGRQ